MIGGATMPALDNITIRGFKSIKAVEGLELNPINVLIGANGSGKSNFIEVFSLLRAEWRPVMPRERRRTWPFANSGQ